MKKITINKREITILSLTLITGIVLGWLFFGHSHSDAHTEKSEAHQHEAADETTWTCSMHPQIKQEEPGQCPICAMNLVPQSSLRSDDETVSPDAIQMSASDIQLASIQTTIVSKGIPENTLHLLGKVQADERRISTLTARYGGRIEKLSVNFTGQQIRKGQVLATLYSPELISVQKELIEAVQMKESNPTYYTAAVNKLKLWDVTDQQIEEIINNKEPEPYFDVRSPITGTITQRHVAAGDYVEAGTALFEVVDLSSVWVMFDAYESDLPWIQKGDPVDFTLPSIPGKPFEGKVSYIDPFIHPKNRIANVRVEVPNPSHQLKPEMFVKGVLQSQNASHTEALLVPKSAVLWTGKRAVVYVKVPEHETPTFLYREITLGAEAGNYYIVADGLSEGEEIAYHGVFKIDASAQLAGKPSMMNPEGIQMSVGHDHGETQTSHTGHEGHAANETHEVQGEHQEHGEHAMFEVRGSCGMCKTRIEETALALDGVSNAHWELDKQLIHLDYHPEQISLSEIHKAIARAGHDTEEEKAPQEVYDELPACCHYRE